MNCLVTAFLFILLHLNPISAVILANQTLDPDYQFSNTIEDVRKCPKDTTLNDFIVYSNPEDCHSFFLCIDTLAHLFNCRTNFTWTPAIEKCQRLGQTACIPPIVNVTRSAPQCVVQKTYPYVEAFFADSDNKSAFFRCDEKADLIHLFCPKNLTWNDEIARCDFPDELNSVVGVDFVLLN